MAHIDWFAALLGISALMVLALHGSLWIAHMNSGEREARARCLASGLYWPVCALVLAIGIAILSVEPYLAENLNRRPELWIFPTIGGSGLVGMRYCLGARWNLGSVFCSAVFICGLLCSGVFVYRHFGDTQDKLKINLHAETYSGGGRPTVSKGAASGDPVERRI